MQLREWGRYRVQAEERPGIPAVVYLRGELDLGNARQLRDLLLGAAEDDDHLVVDMADTTFIDASVLAVLAETNAVLPGGLIVRGATGIVARAFGLVDMDHLLAL